MNQPPYPPPLGAPPPGYAPQGYPPAPGPPGKPPFRLQMWMLGALIIPVGIGFSVRDVMKKNSIELGGECSDSDHCKSHTCLTGDVGACTKTCNQVDRCPPNFSCEQVRVTLSNQAGSHDLGANGYCIRAQAGSPSSSAAAPASGTGATTPEPSATTPSAAASAAPIASAPVAASGAPAPKNKPAKPAKPRR